MKTEVIDKKSEKLWLKKAIIYLVLMLMVFISAVFVVFQVFEYRQDTRKLSSYLRERDDLNADWGRLLIEQQTFGATAQIGTRAVTQLRMYSPPVSQSVVISLPQPSDEKK
ncbi:cell division protein FtsL [Acinetobacter pseudolwoffii]|uniref:cell division protein FtsL n=1 Tax=Acinetobacter pseudolwoffii TaxID=2053287 RepID=UPI001CE03C2E|nr:cell division protein FtsL [Acinetobacter pseudolwoffii]UBX52667.1 cell division protein FtsL [Acinetobacter pseudolwoffii]